jgi:hypothetical protein
MIGFTLLMRLSTQVKYIKRRTFQKVEKRKIPCGAHKAC